LEEIKYTPIVHTHEKKGFSMCYREKAYHGRCFLFCFVFEKELEDR